MGRRNWTRDELLLALNLYCKLPFSQYDQRTPEVQDLAVRIQRTPSAVAMKLANFASLDETHQHRGVSGLTNVSKQDIRIWREFTTTWGDAVLESERLLEASSDYEENPHDQSEALGQITEVESRTKRRLGQKFFRSTVLAIYQTRCCICELPISDLLLASHIIPWSHSKEHRLNPQNGLSLCAIHDRAFDKGYLALSDSFEVILSDRLNLGASSHVFNRYFDDYRKHRIDLPIKFVPRLDFIQYHRAEIFNL